jgi:pyruvate, water dikinase
MAETSPTMSKLLRSLEERAKELNCLYRIEALLTNPEQEFEDVFLGIIKAIPPGWQYPSICQVQIIYNDKKYFIEDDRLIEEDIRHKTQDTRQEKEDRKKNIELHDFIETPWGLKAEIKIQDETVGMIEVYYSEEMPFADEGPFLKEERKLINTLADRLGNFIFHKKLKQLFEEWHAPQAEQGDRVRPEWQIVLDMLRRTDQHLFSLLSRKMINHLVFRGIEESKPLFEILSQSAEEAVQTEQNRPSKKKVLENSYILGIEIFHVAAKYLDDIEIQNLIQRWIYEDKSSFLIKALANPNTPLTEIADAIRKYQSMSTLQEEGSPATKGIRVSLIRRFLTEQLQFIKVAKNYLNVSDFYKIIDTLIFPSESFGKLGGKSAGLILAANILSKVPETESLFKNLKTPKTWYINSDNLMNFVYYNNLEDVIDQKYKDIELIRQEYPHIIQVFKNSQFSPEIINGLSRALDDFGDNPIIVRSSSLLEDRMGSAFAGKYKSLFLANQGTKKEKMDALMDAIAEVYASTFGPEPIGYRIERNLLDFNEEMGIMIQEVVGKRIGKYFFPAFAGVAFSRNEFRWSARIKRDDGLIRIVPGLGTRAVDRIGNDYPILLAPGQPDLRVNLTFDEIVGYSPKYLDVINLETNTFETIPIKKIIEETGDNYPSMNNIFSIKDDRHLRKPIGLGIDTKKHDIIVTFENLFTNTNFVKQIHSILQILGSKLLTPIDIEFASDGENLYLLQCRPQSSTPGVASAIIPKDVAKEKIIFSANKNISNGRIPDIDYIVYVDPVNYAKQENLEDLISIGKVIGKLNKILPKKKFILMGPGRWGSRDDIRLGVKVAYSDINHTAMLIEIALKKGSYIPELSFGTHFFQDLVEASIRYLPLYPDDKNVIFNYAFLLNQENELSALLPEYEYLKDTIRVINVPKSTNGLILRVLMNADDDEALAILTRPDNIPIFNSGNYITTNQ